VVSVIGNRAIESAAIQWIIRLEGAAGRAASTYAVVVALLTSRAHLEPSKSKLLEESPAVRICG
jgi:hypothetical protein